MMNLPASLLSSTPTFRALLFAGLVASICGAHANTVFTFGSTDYATANVGFTDFTPTSLSPAGDAPWRFENSYSATTPLISSATTGYTGPAVHGGYVMINDTQNRGFTGTVDNQAIRNNHGASGEDSLFLSATSGSGNPSNNYDFAATYVFKQSEFNAGFTDGVVGLSAFSVTYQQTGGSLANGYFTPEGRWLVGVAGTYYLSQATFTLINDGSNAARGTRTLDGSALQSTLWAVYDPGDDLFFDADIANFVGLDLSSVSAEAVGVHFQTFDFDSSGTPALRLSVEGVDITAIPEPASAALMGGLAMLVFSLLRRPAR